MRFIALLVITALSVFAQGTTFTPQYEQGYVSTAQGLNVQPLGPHFLPTPATVEALALKFGAQIAVKPFPSEAFAYWVPLEPLPHGWQWTYGFHWPFGKRAPAVERSLVFKKGTKLPSGYVLTGDVAIAAWFFADTFSRKPHDLAVADCLTMIQRHEEQK